MAAPVPLGLPEAQPEEPEGPDLDQRRLSGWVKNTVVATSSNDRVNSLALLINHAGTALCKVLAFINHSQEVKHKHPRRIGRTNTHKGRPESMPQEPISAIFPHMLEQVAGPKAMPGASLIRLLLWLCLLQTLETYICAPRACCQSCPRSRV